MTQNQNNNKPVCKKFYKRFSFTTTNAPPKTTKTSALSQKLPIESDPSDEPASAHHKNKNVTFFLPKMLSIRQDDKKAAPTAKTNSMKDEDKFSDYIKKVKDKMTTVSSVASVRKSTTRRDSFNDNVD